MDNLLLLPIVTDDRLKATTVNAYLTDFNLWSSFHKRVAPTAPLCHETLLELLEKHPPTLYAIHLPANPENDLVSPVMATIEDVSKEFNL